MFLTLEILERYDACEPGKKWFSRYFPNGGELVDVMSHKYAAPDFLHWGYTNLPTSNEEREIYWKKIEVNTPYRWTIYESDHITNCEYVTRSSRIKNSNYIFGCKDIADSNNISSSNNVERSNQIFNSVFIYDSEKVHQSKNITESINIVNSDYVVRSGSVINSAVVTNSYYVGALATGRTKQIKNSAFIFECVNMQNCLFCSHIQNGEYYLFNQPIEKEQFEIIMRQFKSILAGYHTSFMREDWPSSTIPLDTPNVQLSPEKHYANLPEVFWQWVKTLPGYNPDILYSITFQTKMIG